MNPTLEHLERRTARLEKSITGLIALCGALLLIGITGAAAPPPDALQARSFELVGKNGAVLAELTVRDGKPGLYIKDEGGTDRVALFHDAEASGLYVMDAAGTTRIGVAQFAHGGGGVALHGPESKGAAVLYLKGAGSLRFFDAEGNTTNQVLATQPSTEK